MADGYEISPEFPVDENARASKPDDMEDESLPDINSQQPSLVDTLKSTLPADITDDPAADAVIDLVGDVLKEVAKRRAEKRASESSTKDGTTDQPRGLFGRRPKSPRTTESENN